MADPLPNGDRAPTEVVRARRLFEFLKAFAERGAPPARTIGQHAWTMLLSELPAHPSIQVGEVLLAAADGASDPESASAPLLRVVRPRLTPAPTPPDVVLPYLMPSWHSATGAIELTHVPRLVGTGDEGTEDFYADPARVGALMRWREAWNAWAAVERPAAAAMRVFERLYELRGLIEREGEHVELVLGDGRLRWLNGSGAIDHPVLLQRVELRFDAHAPAFELVDAERAPELYTPLLTESSALTPAQLEELRDELEREGYHPLAGPTTSTYLRKLAQLLGPHGQLTAERPAEAPGPHPLIARDPVLLLRARPSGFAAAFDRVLSDLETRETLPTSLTLLVGVESPPASLPEDNRHSPWGEPPDVLLSKPANAEQIQMARALDRHGAVLVQGPPGTGKSHTIANLIGHLMAQGKRVLVTSHTTKALRVLRDQLAEPLQPLCAAVLDSDADSRAQLEQSVRGILARLSIAREDELEREASALAERRRRINADIAAAADALLAVREAEWQPIVLEGSGLSPADAAREVRKGAAASNWIPGPITPGAPPPLADAEVLELYRTNGEVAPEEEEEIAGSMPDPSQLPSANEFAALTDALAESEPDDLRLLWNGNVEPEHVPHLERLASLVRDTASDAEHMSAWERAIAAAGREGGAAAEVWLALRQDMKTAVGNWERSLAILVENQVEIAPAADPDELNRSVLEIVSHLGSGRTLRASTLFRKPAWKRAISACRVNRARPSTLTHFQAIERELTLSASRAGLERRWSRQAEPIGFPSFEALGAEPEPILREYTLRIPELLGWWEARWSALQEPIEKTGFDWQRVRGHEIARAAPSLPFELDVRLVGGLLRHAVTARLLLVRRLEAEERLGQLDETLAWCDGATSSALRESVRARDAAAYDAAYERYLELARKRAVWQRRIHFLDAIEDAAPAWAAAVRERTGVHGEAAPPGEAATAWRWRQLEQEVLRRAELDEVVLAQRIDELRAALHRTTADLIDHLSWLAQLRRTDLSARQALQGWADTVRRIGRGTGRRVPELQAEARRLLARARDAVPVWIMPLARVAESFDARDGKFDVVILDEASQADLTALFAWYVGDSVAVVGDHEQVSPLAVGQQEERFAQLIADHLQEIPNRHLYDGRASVYDLARQCFGGTIALREHFRCVPDIIGFSDALCYDGEIRPLRPARSAPRPHVVEQMIGAHLSPDRTGKTNLSEARLVAALLKAATELPDYDGKTMGAITLLGDEQAEVIQELALEVVGPVELERRRFLAGNAAHFQGDERHVVFLSMVDAGGRGPLRLLPAHDLRFKQRYNVAASRARDQLWLVHSLDPYRDLQKEDLRRRLIEYVRHPGRRAANEGVSERPRSELEKSVANRLVAAGYDVRLGVVVGRYPLSLVVSDAGAEVAIECDGDRFQDFGQIPGDIERQAVLERAGWRFLRVRATRFYRDPDGAMDRLMGELFDLGVSPSGLVSGAVPRVETSSSVRERVVRRAQAIMAERGWVGLRADAGGGALRKRQDEARGSRVG